MSSEVSSPSLETGAAAAAGRERADATPAPARERVAILTSALGGGGAQRSMVRLAGAIAGRGVEVDLVLVRAEGHFRDEVSSSVRIVDLGARRTMFAVPAIVRYLKEERPSALLSSLDYVNIVALWSRRLARVPVRIVVNEQNTLSAAVANARTWRTRSMPRLIGRFYPWADGVTTVSIGVADDLAEATGIARETITVIHNPVVTPALREMAEAPLDHPWFEPGEPPVFLSLGRMVPQKDFPNLLAAFASVRRSHEARLMILGEGPDRAALEFLAGELGLDREDVSMPGWVVNPYPYILRSRAFVLSSAWEGLPTVLIEALCCGTRVVATDCPSGPREILQGGRFGPLVPVGDPGALGSAMVQALSDDAQVPPDESWAPYIEDEIATRYLDILLGAPVSAG
jgi:glycosyltransferase involved in cell wall biosynthesis